MRVHLLSMTTLAILDSTRRCLSPIPVMDPQGTDEEAINDPTRSGVVISCLLEHTRISCSAVVRRAMRERNLGLAEFAFHVATSTNQQTPQLLRFSVICYDTRF